MIETGGYHVVLGAAGGAGCALTNELARQGLSVRAVRRRASGPWPNRVEVVPVDLMRSENVRKACRGAAVVYYAANVPYLRWLDVLPAMTDNLIAGAFAADAVLVVVDNLYMYGPPIGPMTEATPRWASGPKGPLRVRLEERFLAAHASTRVGVAIGCGSDFYGPHANSAANQLVIKHARRRKTASWLGSLDAPHTLTYLPDFARGLITLGRNARAWGEVWHIPSGPPVTGRTFIAEVYKELGQPFRIKRIGRGMMTIAGLFNRQIREAREVLYQFEQPFVMDALKVKQTFGGTVTPLREGIRETLAALRAVP
ncbi:NAD-dependent epimerase/dehydratase family protein [Microvirga roseola]|uniref:NAD-dependent epimerase/dehydratase family protein n=1 Tax=Microvirga roseola TaxID=2883126 RepID=UPI001E342674|nr:NAD-dependent epimerase/dehydratase family protein [Microvirga roseola]